MAALAGWKQWQILTGSGRIDTQVSRRRLCRERRRGTGKLDSACWSRDAPRARSLTNCVRAGQRQLEFALSPKEKAELGDLIDPSKPQQTAYALQCNLPTEATETLLVIDQFDELFTQTPEHLRAPFVDWVLTLIAPGAVLGFRVILTIRSDYFNLCSTHPALFALLKQDNVMFRLKQITDEGLAEVVHKPLLLAGHKDRAEQQALVADAQMLAIVPVIWR